MQIRFVKDYRRWREGDVMEVGAGPGLEFVRRGVAERIDETTQAKTNKRSKRKAQA